MIVRRWRDSKPSLFQPSGSFFLTDAKNSRSFFLEGCLHSCLLLFFLLIGLGGGGAAAAGRTRTAGARPGQGLGLVDVLHC